MASRKSHLSHLSRRQTLSLMGLGGLASTLTNPLDVLVNGLAEGIIQKAAAANLPPQLKARNFVYLNLGGGAPRWIFDNPLNPYAGSLAPMAASMVKTRFNSAGIPEYVTTNVTRGGVTLQMPWLWNSQIPTVSGGTVPMADLLTNMLMIRGVNLMNDGHELNALRQLRPMNSAPSLDGSVADHSHTPIPAVRMPGAPENVFKSAKGVGQAYSSYLAPGLDPLRLILGAFDRTQYNPRTGRRDVEITSSYLNRRNAMDTVVKKTLGLLKDHAASRMPGSENLFDMRHSAEKLILQGVGDVKTSFAALYEKYSNLIARCAAAAKLTDPNNPMTIPGVTDTIVPLSNCTLGDKGAPLQAGFTGGYCRNTDLRTIIQAESSFYAAGGFAVAEYLLINGYSSTASFGYNGVNNLFHQSPSTYGDPSVLLADDKLGTSTFDEHGTGSFYSLIVQSFHYRALSACLYEFISQLKANNLFEETVIQLGGDFGRNPRNDESGSDHGWMADSTSLLSGAIKAPLVLGNSKLDGGSHGKGTWGASAKVKVDGADQELTIGHKTSTISHLLRVAPIFTNNSSLIEGGTGAGINPLIEKATIKDEGGGTK